MGVKERLGGCELRMWWSKVELCCEGGRRVHTLQCRPRMCGEGCALGAGREEEPGLTFIKGNYPATALIVIIYS